MTAADAIGRQWREDQVAAMTSALAIMLAQQPLVGAALLGTPDGFVLTAEALDPAAMERLSAMTSSMVALADAVSREMGLGASQYLLSEGASGRLLMQPIEMGSGDMLLLALTCDIAMPANQLSQIAERLAGQLMLDLSD